MTALQPPAAELEWKKTKVVKALTNGDIITIACTGLCIRFVLKGGVDSGYLVKSDGAIKRFKSDEAGWTYVEQLKSEAGV